MENTTAFDDPELYHFKCHITSETNYPLQGDNASSYILASMGVNIFIAILTVILNSVVMMAIYKAPHLHTPSNFILFNTAVSDFCNGLLSAPLFTGNYLNIFFQREHHCALFIIMMVSIHFFSLLSFWLILMVGIDRYIAIFKPYFYHEKVVGNKEKYVYIVLILWLVNGSLLSVSYYFQMFNLILAIEGASLLIIVIYSGFIHVRIYLKVRNINWKIRMESSRRSDKYKEETIKNRALGRQEARVALLTFFMLTSICICYIPFSIVVFSWWWDIKDTWPIILNMWGFTCVLFKSLLNPLIYCFSLTSIRKATKIILCGHSRSKLIHKPPGNVIGVQKTSFTQPSIAIVMK